MYSCNKVWIFISICVYFILLVTIILFLGYISVGRDGAAKESSGGAAKSPNQTLFLDLNATSSWNDSSPPVMLKGSVVEDKAPNRTVVLQTEPTGTQHDVSLSLNNYTTSSPSFSEASSSSHTAPSTEPTTTDGPTTQSALIEPSLSPAPTATLNTTSLDTSAVTALHWFTSSTTTTTTMAPTTTTTTTAPTTSTTTMALTTAPTTEPQRLSAGTTDLPQRQSTTSITFPKTTGTKTSPSSSTRKPTPQPAATTPPSLDSSTPRLAVVEAAGGALTRQLVDMASLLAVLLFGLLFFLVTVAVFVTQAYESYRRKDYTQVDYLINGMYSDSGVWGKKSSISCCTWSQSLREEGLSGQEHVWVVSSDVFGPHGNANLTNNLTNNWNCYFHLFISCVVLMVSHPSPDPRQC